MTLHHGDCLDVMAGMGPESVDAIVTDPPYGLEFMGKEWDNFAKFRTPTERDVERRARVKSGSGIDTLSDRRHPSAYVAGPPAQAFHFAWAEAAYRVAKPSAYLLAFGGTRTVHRMTVALEDAGWIIRDMLVWAYASGFPKSKASLKPAWEPIVMARKPGPLRDLAIDECRIPAPEGSVVSMTYSETGAARGMGGGLKGGNRQDPQTLGRWPANVILTDPIFDGGVEGVVGGGETTSGSRSGLYAGSGAWSGEYGPVTRDIDGDSGTYSRFFLIPKADRADREPVLGGQTERTNIAFGNGTCANCGHARFDGRRDGPCCGEPDFEARQVRARENVHPTVKPTDLMRHLVRLVTPPGGVVLDPFLGSGTTAIAAEMEGFAWVGIEREAEYVQIAEARLNGTQKGLGLVG